MKKEYIYIYIFWFIDPLLGKDLETNKTTAVAMQWLLNRRIYNALFGTTLAKHAPMQTNTHVTIYLLSKRDVFSVVCAEILWAGQFEANEFSWALQRWLRRNGAIIEFCMEVCEQRTWVSEDEESALLKSVTRKSLVNTAGWKRLSGCRGVLRIVEISARAVICIKFGMNMSKRV
jgi:hypothetical protein